jgi:hypothetical protein
LSRGSPLVVLSAIDIATPFLRMLVLTHFLDLRGIGFRRGAGHDLRHVRAVAVIQMNCLHP